VKILGIETATEVCGVAVVENDTPVIEYRIHRKNVHAEKLVKAIHFILSELGGSARDLDGMAVSIGPGSFTGLRIGLSAAKGMALALDLPVVGVNTLDALAYSVTATPYLVAVLLRARGSEMYSAFYRKRNSTLQRVSDYRVVTAEELKEQVGEKTVIVQSGLGSLLKQVRDVLGERAVVLSEQEYLASAFSVAFLGLQKLGRGEADDLDTLEPMYLKDFVPGRVGQHSL